jgi:ADP-ribose pyrophosphatase YjhB (NUDIX family)
MNKEYKNPKPAVDIIIEGNSRILLVKRKNEPFKDHLEPPGATNDNNDNLQG